jgi:hypothetical protein
VEDVTFGYGGRAPALKQPGLGVTVDASSLGDFVVKQQEFALP